MKKNLGFFSLACCLLILLGVNVSSADTKTPKAEQVNTTKEKTKYVHFEKEYCVQISRNPNVTVCVNGISNTKRIKSESVKSIKPKTLKLLKKYLNEKNGSNREFLCSGPNDWVPEDCGGAASYCEANPTDGRCPSACDEYDWHYPYCGATSFCTANPTHGTCPSACDFDDWHDPYCGAASYCDANPTDGRCPSACDFYDWHYPYCGATSYCTANPTDPQCN